MENRFSDGVRLFNAGQFFEAHEAWEDEWRSSQEPERRWLQGLVQCAVAMHHLFAGNRAGGRSVLERAINNLSDCPSMHRGIDVSALRQKLNALRRDLDTDNALTPFVIERAED